MLSERGIMPKIDGVEYESVPLPSTDAMVKDKKISTKKINSLSIATPTFDRDFPEKNRRHKETQPTKARKSE
jgi:hypothetical protein